MQTPKRFLLPRVLWGRHRQRAGRALSFHIFKEVQMQKVEWIVTCKHDEEFEGTFASLADALSFMEYNGSENYELVKLVYDL